MVAGLTRNGSKSILCCSLNDEQTHLEDMWKISAEEVMQDHQQSLANAGQHMRLMLRKVLQHVPLSRWGSICMFKGT